MWRPAFSRPSWRPVWRLLEEGLARNAAGKAFQAWRALLAALLRLELDRLKALVKAEEERRWLETTAVPRVPTTKIKALANLLEDLGHGGVSAWTDKALNLHDYQHNGPDPDMALSTTRGEAAVDVRRLAAEVARLVESLKPRVRWTEELERALEEAWRASGR